MPPLHQNDFHSFLNRVVDDRGEGAFTELTDFIADYDDTLIMVPSITALCAWGARGLDKITEIALTNSTVKAKTTAFKIFSTLACGLPLNNATLFFQDKNLLKKIDLAASEHALESKAKQSLKELILSLPDDELFLPAGMFFTQTDIYSDDAVRQSTNITKEFLAALSTKWLHFGPNTIDEYEDLITKKRPEPEFQTYLCRYPQLIDPLAVKVWDRPNLNGLWIPDFIIQRADGTYLVVEIECPGKSLVTNSGNISSSVTHAERQINDYINYLDENIFVFRNNFPNLRGVEGLAVIGVEGDLSSDQRDALKRSNAMRRRMKTVGFDYLAERAKILLQNIGRGELEVIKNYRSAKS